MRGYDRKKVPLEVYQKLELQMMPTRHESAIYTTMTIKSESLKGFLKENNLKIFSWVIYACLKTVKEYPMLKRFVLKGVLYEHKKLTIATVVKKDKTIEGDNGFVKLVLDKTMSAHDVHSQLYHNIDESRTSQGNGSDALMKVMGVFPTGIFRLIKGVLSLLDRFDLLPNSIIDSDPLHTTAMIANLGSIKGHSVQHHLYNWGTASLFITFGRLRDDGTLDLTFTIDERISEGMVLFKALDYFRHIMENPYEHV
jgi:hypothetical protein